MDSEKKLIKYIKNELTPDERIAVENELQSSSGFREEYQKYLKVLKLVEYTKRINLNQNYKDSILPSFRNKIVKSKSVNFKKSLALAFGIMLIFILSVIVFNKILTTSSSGNKIEEFTKSLNEQQRIDLLESLNGDIDEYYLVTDKNTNVEISEIIQRDIQVNNEIAEVYGISYTEILDDLSTTEVQTIYNKILSTNFSKEANL